MKNLQKYTSVTILSLSFLMFLYPFIVFGQANTSDYRLLAPIPINGGTSEVTSLSADNFAGYIQGIINLIIGLSTVLAVLWFMFGGFTYMTQEAVDSKGEGKQMMTNAIYGLLLLLSSWLILSTINPQLLNLDINKSITDARNSLKNNTSSPPGNDDQIQNPPDIDPLNQTPRNITYASAAYGGNITCVECVDLTGVPIEAGQQCMGQTCKINAEIATKLQNLSARSQDWEVKEAWPPTTKDATNSCYQNGSCVDINFSNGSMAPVAQNDLDYVDKMTFQVNSITALAGATSLAGFGQSAAVYKVKTAARAAELREAGLPSTITVQVVPAITAEYFSLYNR